MWSSSTTPTFTYQSRSLVTLTSNADGLLGVVCLPYLSSQVRTAATFDSDGKVLTWNTATNDPAYSSLATIIQAFRVVTFGVRIVSSCAPTEAKGFWTAGAFSLPVSTSGDTFQVGNLTGYSEVSDGSVFNAQLWFTSRSGGPKSERFIDPASDGFTATDYEQNDRTALWFGASGLPASTACFTVEIVANYEVQPQTGDFISSLATPSWTNLFLHALAGKANAQTQQLHRDETPQLLNAKLEGEAAKVAVGPSLGESAKIVVKEGARAAAPYVGRAAGRAAGAAAARLLGGGAGALLGGPAAGYAGAMLGGYGASMIMDVD